MLYMIVTINGKQLSFYADEVDSDESTHRFLEDGEIVSEFERKNIAGYIAFEEKDVEEDDE